MAIKGGQILHTANGFLIDRIQTGGVNSLNINEDRIEELGNYEAIGTTRDIPDLTFELETYDMSTSIENINTGRDEDFSTATTELDLVGSYSNVDILSPYKGSGTFDIIKSIAVPYLYPESLSYSFALNDPASLTASYRGDSIFYSPGDVYRETADGDGTTAVFTYGAGTGGVAGPSLKTVIDSVDYFALAVIVDGVKQLQGATADYTSTATAVTFNAGHIPVVGTGNVVLIYANATLSQWLQAVHNSTVPIAVRGRNIEVIVADSGGANPVSWTGVQSASVDWSVSLERDEEFNNPFVVAQDFDTPETSGSISLKPSNATELFDKIMQAAGVTASDEVANATNDVPEMEVTFKIMDPADGTTLKTLVVDDAKFVLPAMSGSVGSKLETDFTFTSTSGVLKVYVADPA